MFKIVDSESNKTFYKENRFTIDDIINGNQIQLSKLQFTQVSHIKYEFTDENKYDNITYQNQSYSVDNTSSTLNFIITLNNLDDYKDKMNFSIIVYEFQSDEIYLFNDVLTLEIDQSQTNENIIQTKTGKILLINDSEHLTYQVKLSQYQEVQLLQYKYDEQVLNNVPYLNIDNKIYGTGTPFGIYAFSFSETSLEGYNKNWIAVRNNFQNKIKEMDIFQNTSQDLYYRLDYVLNPTETNNNGEIVPYFSKLYKGIVLQDLLSNKVNNNDYYQLPKFNIFVKVKI